MSEHDARVADIDWIVVTRAGQIWAAVTGLYNGGVAGWDCIDNFPQDVDLAVEPWRELGVPIYDRRYGR